MGNHRTPWPFRTHKPKAWPYLPDLPEHDSIGIDVECRRLSGLDARPEQGLWRHPQKRPNTYSHGPGFQKVSKLHQM
jgi:hypothetical protein